MKIKEGKQEWHDKFINTDNQSIYEGNVVLYAKYWADMMESEISKGNTLSEIAYETSFEADTIGISGNMFRYAVKFLVNCWEYGNELHRWYKEYYNIKDNVEVI